MNSTWKRIVGNLGFAGLALLGAWLFVGCGGGKSATGPAQYYGNYHKPNWITEHPGQAVAGIDACTACHQISLVSVGNGVPTCLTTGCHHQATPNYAGANIHGTHAKAAADPISGGSLVSCQICHGSNFAGGPSAYTCFTCHGVNAPHPPKPWRTSAGSAYSHTTTDPSNAAACAQCHYPGSPSNPAGHPASPAPAGTQPGCYNATLCHGANTAPHPVPFLTGQLDSNSNGHLTVTATAFAADCATCHSYSGTSPRASAPLCNVCHKLADPTVPGTNAGTCLSCHSGTAGMPQGPGGSGFPSIAGAHLKHMNLPTQLTCDTCHAGAGTGTTAHYTNADLRLPNPPAGPAPVVISAVFTPLNGTAPSFTSTSLTCSNVSCHGAQTTPGWQNGTINSATQCTACHGIATTAGTITQYNDAFGRHSQGTHNATNAANAIACTTCHNMANGTPGALAHFKYLNTTAVDGTSTGTPADQMPSGTIVFDTSIVTGAGTYNVTATGTAQGNGGCALTCHTHIHAGAPLDTWQSSGAPHPVPFLSGQSTTQGNSHLTATLATFTTDCSVCHSISGTSPNPASPACQVCHKLADPTVVATGAGTCNSCHSGPPGLPLGPTGGSFPGIAGAHNTHMTLPTALTCATCHAGSTSGTATHYANANARISTPVGPATVTFDPAYNAKSLGTAVFNASADTCSNTSCHGGQATPVWTSTTKITTSCALCHKVNGGTTSSQYNDATGRHSYGTHAQAAAADCTLCHDMSAANTNLGAVNHFAQLNLHAVTSATKLPSGTIVFKTGNATFPISALGTPPYVINPAASLPETDGGCALTCHTQIHTATSTTNHWGAPQGSGVAHPVPFLSTSLSAGGNHHQSVTLAQFNTECSTCHDQTNTPPSTKTGPVCTVCHTLGSPLSAGMGVGTCLSCHTGTNFPTVGPTGTAWPNLAGAHPKHMALQTFTRTTPALPASLTASAYSDCEACHVGSVPYDPAQTHYSNANKRLATPVTTGPASVSVDPTFNSQASVAGYTASITAFTCSNISCHGGQVTPGWQTGTNPVNATTYCTACHVVGAAEYNAPTGRHASSEHRQTCDYCHDMTQAKPGAQNHFKYLDTTVVSGVSGTPSDQYPSDTILFGSSVTGTRTYTVTGAGNAQGQGGCALTCHGENHTTSNNHWN
jgi:predicted CxxxxCH...CXXCH cytochrome family protein